MRKTLFLTWNASGRRRAGHWYWVPLSLSQFKGSRGFEVATLACNNLGYWPLLPNSSFESVNSGISIFSRPRLAMRIRDLSSELRVDSISIYEGTIAELEVAVRVAALCPQLTIHFNFYDGLEICRMLGAAAPSELANLKSTLSAHPNLAISCETEPLNELVRRELHIDSQVFPVFTTLDYQLEAVSESLSLSGEKRSRAVISVGKEEDLRLALEIVKHCKSEFSEISFVIQPRIRIPSEKIELMKLQGVEVLTLLDPVEYKNLLESARVWIFTYSPKEYALKSSGRVQDCLLMGVIPIVPKGTALSSQWARGGDYTYEIADLSTLKNAIRRASESLENPTNHAITRRHYVDFLDQLVLTRKGVQSDSQTPRAQKSQRVIKIPGIYRSRGTSFKHVVGRALVRLGVRRP